MNRPDPRTLPLEQAPPATPAGTSDPVLGLPDWRFLLAGASLGHVGLGLGVGLDERVDDDSPFDTIVLERPDRRRLRAAIDALSPTGTIRLEHVARRRRGHLRSLLEAAGFEVRTWWHRPALADTWAIVGLDRPAAAATVLRGVAGRRRRGPAEAFLARTGLARRCAAEVAMMAGRSEGATHPHPSVLAPTRSTPVDALLTPRYQTSRAVIGVSTTADGSRIEHVAKVARSPLDADQIRWEAAALDAFRSRVADPGAAPSAHRLVERDDQVVLIEAGAPGRPLDRRLVRHDPVAALEAGVAWLEQVKPSDLSAPAVDGRAERLVDPALARLHTLGGARHAERRDAATRADRLLDQIRERPLPVIFEHGDLSHPNIFFRGDGRIAVIDWERAEPEGLPLHDLTYLTAYLAESVAPPRDHEGLVAAHHGACGPIGWARATIDRHLDRLGIDPVHAALLELVAWTRYLAALATTPSQVRRPTPHRCEVLWMAALERAEAVAS